MGLRGGIRHRNAHRPRPSSACEARAEHRHAATSRDRVGRRLPVRAVIGFALLVGMVALGVGVAATLGLRLLPTVRLQLVGLALLAVLLPLAVVLLSGWVMFHMGDDVK